jgi:hypothetical protein
VLVRTYILPEGFEAGELPERVLLTGPALSFDGGWSRQEESGELVFRGKLKVRDALVAVEDYPRVREFLTGLQEYLSRTIPVNEKPRG